MRGGRFNATDETLVTHSLRADGFDASEDGTGRGTPLTLAIRGRGGESTLETRDDGLANAILTPNGGRGGIGVGAVAFDARQSDIVQYGEKTGPLDTCGFTMGVQQAMAVRQLTPRECERLQGFPDDYTLIQIKGKPAADGPRYKALGNSMAVPVMAWIGRRIATVEILTT
jgi:DNA (cytosine-5)-methyltransferase 1